MKKWVFLLCVLAMCFTDSLAQEPVMTEETPTTSTTEEKLPARLRIRNKVLRPLGKDWYVTVSAGYGMPFLATNRRSPLKEIGDKDWYQHYGDLSVKPLFGTNGGGFATNIGWGHMFNEHIGIDVLHTIAWHPEKLDARIDLKQKVLGMDASYYATEKTGTFAMYISPHMIMRWDNGKRFGITGKAGIVIPMFGKTSSRAYILDKQGRVLETLTGQPIIPIPFVTTELIARASTSYNPTIGLSASIGFDVKLSKRATFFLETRVQAYTIRLKETIFDEFQLHASINILGLNIPIENGALPIPTQIDNVSEAPTFLVHYVYQKEITKESNTARYGKPLDEIDLNRPMDEPGQIFNASTLYFNAGIRIDFNLWDRKRFEKRTQQIANKHKKSGK
jgi:hypothetical protein